MEALVRYIWTRYLVQDAMYKTSSTLLQNRPTSCSQSSLEAIKTLEIGSLYLQPSKTCQEIFLQHEASVHRDIQSCWTVTPRITIVPSAAANSAMDHSSSNVHRSQCPHSEGGCRVCQQSRRVNEYLREVNPSEAFAATGQGTSSSRQQDMSTYLEQWSRGYKHLETEPGRPDRAQTKEVSSL